MIKIGRIYNKKKSCWKSAFSSRFKDCLVVYSKQIINLGVQ